MSSWCSKLIEYDGIFRICKCCVLDFIRGKTRLVTPQEHEAATDGEPIVGLQRAREGEQEEAPTIFDIKVFRFSKDSINKHLKRTHSGPEAYGEMSIKFKTVDNSWVTSGAKALVARSLNVTNKQTSQRTIAQMWASDPDTLMRHLSSEELAVLFASSSYLPFRQIENPFLRVILSRAGIASSIGRNNVANRMNALALKLETKLLNTKRNCVAYMTVDSGTVWERYIVVMLHVRGCPPIVAGSFDDASLAELVGEDDDREGARHTIDNLAKMLSTCIKFVLETFCIHVLSIVTDNCANVVGMAESVSRFPFRCMCHGLALIVNHVTDQPEFKKLIDATKKWYSDNKELLTKSDVKYKYVRPFNDTRWNSTLHFISDIAELVEQHNDTPKKFPATLKHPIGHNFPGYFHLLKNLIQVLLPFEKATLMVEGDESDIIDAIEAVGVMTEAIESLPFSVVNDCKLTFRKNLLSPGHVIVAFFCPVYDTSRTDIEAVRALIAKWLGGASAVNCWCECMDTTPAKLVEEFNIYCSMQKEAFEGFSREDFTANLAKAKACASKLFELVRQLSRSIPSEASAERYFRWMALTGTSDRKALDPSSLAASVRLNAMARHLMPKPREEAAVVDLDEPVTDTQSQVGQQQQQKRDDEQEARNEEEQKTRRRNRFQSAVAFILEQVQPKLTETQNAAANVKQGTRCTLCNSSIANHANKPVALRCCRCQSVIASSCANVFVVPGKECDFVCKPCGARGVPWWQK
jgi:hypothetical protein